MSVSATGIVRAELTSMDGQIALDDLEVVYEPAVLPKLYESVIVKHPLPFWKL